MAQKNNIEPSENQTDNEIKFPGERLTGKMNFIQIKGTPFLKSEKNGIEEYINNTGEIFPDYKAAELSLITEDADEKSAKDEVKSEVLENDANIIQIIIETLKKYVYLENEDEYIIIAAYILLTYCFQLFYKIPYLNLRGEKDSGKTNLIAVMNELVSKPESYSSISEASIFRTIDTEKPTLFLDEVEHLSKRSAAHKRTFDILNSGYQKNGKLAITIKNVVSDYSTFCPKILAAIAKPIDTLESRCIVINMVPAPNKINTFSDLNVDRGEFAKVKIEINAWLHKNAAKLISLAEDINNIDILGGLKNRELDKWSPLFLILKTLEPIGKPNYQVLLSSYIYTLQEKEEAEERNLPKNKCREVLINFAKTYQRDKEKVFKADNAFYYISAEKFFDEITEKDTINGYNSQADVTKVLKRTGIQSGRRRFGGDAKIVYYLPAESVGKTGENTNSLEAVSSAQSNQVQDSEILITTVKAESGWLSNMSAHPITYQGVEYKTCEALFQCLRFDRISRYPKRNNCPEVSNECEDESAEASGKIKE